MDALSSSSSSAAVVHHATAQQQHARYCQTLQSIPNVTVHYLPDLHDQPDACFVEDTAVVVGPHAVLLRPGHVSRRREVESVATALRHMQGVEIVADMRRDDTITSTAIIDGGGAGAIVVACADGGDILRVGGEEETFLFCGRSSRTNDAGIDVLEEAFGGTTSQHLEIVRVDPPTPGFLHLKSVATALTGDAVVLYQDSSTDPLADLFRSKGLRVYPIRDALACNVVAVNQTIVAQEKMDTASLRVLEQAAVDNGLDLVHVDTSELAKKDAALTCCSIIIEDPAGCR